MRNISCALRTTKYPNSCGSSWLLASSGCVKSFLFIPSIFFNDVTNNFNLKNTPEFVSCYPATSSVPVISEPNGSLNPSKPISRSSTRPSSKQSANPSSKALIKSALSLPKEDQMDTGSENMVRVIKLFLWFLFYLLSKDNNKIM